MNDVKRLIHTNSVETPDHLVAVGQWRESRFAAQGPVLAVVAIVAVVGLAAVCCTQAVALSRAWAPQPVPVQSEKAIGTTTTTQSLRVPTGRRSRDEACFVPLPTASTRSP